jgi:iron complex outermembrane receptor protein
MSRKALSGAFTALTSLYVSHVLADSPDAPLQTVVITASPITTDPDHIATIVETVDRDDILRKGGANLADALSDVPGVTGTSFASGASRPVIRGFDANRVKTLEDGIGSFDVSDVGPDHGVPIDPFSAQKVEVVRGAATLRYGSQAIGGVVNAINNRVPTELPDKPFSGEVTGSFGTNADSRQGAAQFDGKLGQLAFHADGFDRHADDYDIPGGTMNNSFFRGDGYSGGASYFFGDSRMGADVVHYDSKYGIPGEDTFIDMQQTKELLRSSFSIDAGAFQTLNVEGGYADYEHSEIDPDSGEKLSTFKDREWDSRAEGVFGAVGPFSGAAVGVQAQRKNFSALGEGGDYLFPTLTRTEAAFAFAEAPLANALKLQTGARVEDVHIDGTPASDVAVSRGNVPRMPPYHVGAGLSWTAAQLDGGFLVKYAGRQNDTAIAETPTAGFVNVDAQLGWRPVASNPDMELVLVGHNLTDATQRNSVALNKDDVILQGRDVRLLFRAAF